MSKHWPSKLWIGSRTAREISALLAIVLSVVTYPLFAESTVRVLASDRERNPATRPVEAIAVQGSEQAAATSDQVDSNVHSAAMAPASTLVELYDYAAHAANQKVAPLEWQNVELPQSGLTPSATEARAASKRVLVTAVPETPDVFTLHFNSVASEATTAAKATVATNKPLKIGASPKLVDLFNSRSSDVADSDPINAETAAATTTRPSETDITPIAPEVMFAARPNVAAAPYHPPVGAAAVQPVISSQFANGLMTMEVAAPASVVQTDVSLLVEAPRLPEATEPPTPLLHDDYSDMAAPKIASKLMLDHHTEPPLAHEPIVDPVPCGPDMTRFLYGCPYYPTQSGARTICGVDCGPYCASCNATWHDARCIPWSLFGPGEYVGPARTVHVSAYHLRVNDLLTLTYIASRQKSADRYRIGVGDRLRIESGTDETLDREVEVQPDGEITLPLIGDVTAAGKTVSDFRDELVERYRQVEREPIITVTPVMVNVGLQEILRAVTSQSRSAGQALDLRVTPEGTIQAPGIGSVYVQGLTLEELRSELEARYDAAFGPGLLISPALTERATSYVFVGGEVRTPGRYTLEGPTTVMQAIALAGGWNNGGNVRQVVVFRRDENWCLKATKINLRKPLYGKDPCPVNDVWLRDNDLVLVPKSPILCAADLIELYFTRGIYAVFPINYVYDFSSGSSVVPVGP